MSARAKSSFLATFSEKKNILDMPFYSGNRESFLQNRHNVQEQKKRFPRIRGQKKRIRNMPAESLLFSGNPTCVPQPQRSVE